MVGKVAGIAGASWLVTRFTRAEFADDLGWPDLIGVALLGGIGFTVSLLIGELAFGVGSERDDHVKVGVLVGTLLSALLATVVLRLRNRRYRRIYDLEQVDADNDAVPDVFQGGTVGDEAGHDPGWRGSPPPGRTLGGSADG